MGTPCALVNTSAAWHPEEEKGGSEAPQPWSRYWGTSESPGGEISCHHVPSTAGRGLNPKFQEEASAGGDRASREKPAACFQNAHQTLGSACSC